MPSNNRIILASAGSGKTTRIIDDACGALGARAAVITYTNNGISEIRAKTYERIGFVPPNLTISTWYAFLLRHFVRPYQNCLYSRRVSQIIFVNGISDRFSKATNIARHYFGAPGRIYGDKVSKFACEVIRKTGGLPLQRFEKIFNQLYIDESQDLAGYDLELIELLMRSRISITLVGDHRQATFATNYAAKNKGFARAKVIDKFEEWQKAGLCKLEYQYQSHRCIQAICDFADQLHPHLPKTNSLNSTITDHDGVFAVPQSQVHSYISIFHPQILRYSRAFKEVPGSP
ncbi:MAG TPA: UvrD-helicase domain-containing protein [Candidatus Saccharimonadales bacterium]|nr:UvrD-helicase domain-containing protein [Candidatus Saccharimonadales bacterium]